MIHNEQQAYCHMVWNTIRNPNITDSIRISLEHRATKACDESACKCSKQPCTDWSAVNKNETGSTLY